MYILVGCVIAAVIIILATLIYSVFKEQITFFITGLDAKFTFGNLILLWRVAKICGLETPTNLFWSMNALTSCMAHITSHAASEQKENDPETQKLISKLFDYRTKLQNESDEKKGLDTTLSLEKGQKLRIIFPGKGVFYSKIINNGKEIYINVPRQKNLITVPAEEWDGKVVSVYLWRKGDARYIFDTVVKGHGMFLGESTISLRHSNNLIRTQKRKAVRAKCDINAQLYIIRSKDIDYAVETKNGYKCHIEDISESGALIRIGGKGVENIQIKLQFPIQNTLVIMVGAIKTVEFNQTENQSLLHFECVHIEPAMRNAVLSYVYNMLPEKDKEIYDALSQTDDDERAEAEEKTKQNVTESGEILNNNDLNADTQNQNSTAQNQSGQNQNNTNNQTQNLNIEKSDVQATAQVLEPAAN
ncbi:MAG: PilZ domain-containing protein [Treponema sp.]|nr:PilZ domain-containing protein [Treponema sp.]